VCRLRSCKVVRCGRASGADMWNEALTANRNTAANKIKVSCGSKLCALYGKMK